MELQNDPVRLAVFGLGRIGTLHLKNLRWNLRAEIVYCVDESEERIEYIKHDLKLREATFLKPSEAEVVFQDKSIHCILVLTPAFSHEQLVLKSLNSGKAVFCEKPLATTEEGIKRCLDAAKKLSLPILCGFNRRFDPGLRSLKTRVESGEIGKVHVIKMCCRDSPRSPISYLKTAGGIFQDCAIHALDYICWLLGEYPESIIAYGSANSEDIREIGDYDTVIISMKFPSGALSVIDLSRHAVYGLDQRAEVFGPKGMLTDEWYRPTGVSHHHEKGATAVPICYEFESRYRDSYALEMEHLLNVVQGIEKCTTDPDSILASYKVSAACERAAKTGNTVHFDYAQFTC